MENIRRPVVAGMFYPSDSEQLAVEVSEFMRKIRATGRCFGVISPHAGYIYSGLASAWAIASLKQAHTFVILGPNHNGMGERFSVMSSGSWETPMGTVKINHDVAARMMDECGFVREDSAAHLMEHSIEVQLPFLQYRFGKKFEFVPVSIMNTDYSTGFLEECEKLGQFIASLSENGNIGVIASSDFSHYLAEKQAEEKDRKALAKILSLNAKGLFKVLQEVNGSVCGYGPIAVAMAAAKSLGLSTKKLYSANSGHVTGDFDSIVTYHAVGFC